MTREQIEMAYRKKGLEVEHGYDEPHKVYLPHRHEKTFLFTLAGTIEIRVNNDLWRTFHAGEECVIGSGELHQALVGQEGWEYVAAWDAEEARVFEQQ